MFAGKKGKFGFFQSEEASYRRIVEELGICEDPYDANRFARYPLVFLVEAARLWTSRMPASCTS